MSSNDNNSFQEKSHQEESNSMNIDEDDNIEEDNSINKSSNLNSFIRASNQKNLPSKKHQKKSSRVFKKAKHPSKKSKYINKSQRELTGSELAISLDKQAKEHFLYKPFYSVNFSKSGEFICSGGIDGDVYLWRNNLEGNLLEKNEKINGGLAYPDINRNKSKNKNKINYRCKSSNKPKIRKKNSKMILKKK